MNAASFPSGNGDGTRTPLVVGHSSRLRDHGGLRWLVLGQFAVFGLSLEDEEIVEAAIMLFGLPGKASFIMEVGLSLALFLIWGALMIGWVRLIDRVRGAQGPRP